MLAAVWYVLLAVWGALGDVRCVLGDVSNGEVIESDEFVSEIYRSNWGEMMSCLSSS